MKVKSFFSNLLKRTRKYQYNVGICCIIKDENDYLEEWIKYHLQIGVDQFYIYDNQSILPIQSTLSVYIESGIVKVIPFPGQTAQLAAYHHFLENYKNECRWIAFIDIDEFIVPKSTFGNLPEFLCSYEKYGGVGLNWLVFGSNGHVYKPKGTQVESFTKRSLKTNPINKHIKSIVQTQYVKSASTDPHHFSYTSSKYCVNENHDRIQGPFSDNSTNLIQINHYVNRSLEEYHEKIARGRADFEQKRPLSAFYDIDKFANEITDESILEIKMIKQSK